MNGGGIIDYSLFHGSITGKSLVELGIREDGLIPNGFESEGIFEGKNFPI
jgi:hypothetical protein